jgi:hypothetical protein
VPTLDELWGIFDQTMAGQQGLHPMGGIRLSWPAVWSSTQGNNSEEKWAFSLHNGSRGSSKLGPSNINRALCVRGSDFRPSPHNGQVGSCIISFEACSAFTRVTTCRLTESPYATLYTGGSGGFVASTAAPIAPGWSDPVPGRVFLLAVDRHLFTAHCNGWLRQLITIS